MVDATQLFEIRRGSGRGVTRVSWLKSLHSFSFGDYYDPERMRFGKLRVLNEDWVAGGGGFGEHGHRDMEILTWVLEGEIRHRDSLGHEEVIRPGEAQVMTAGSGIRHSEFNASDRDKAHFLQIWIEPREKGLEPRYWQKMFEKEGRTNALQLIASEYGESDSLELNQDVKVYAADLSNEWDLNYEIGPGRLGWLQITRGKLNINGREVEAGDGVGFNGKVRITGKLEEAGIVLFDMAD